MGEESSVPRTVHIPARLPLLLFQGSNAHVVAERGSDRGCRDVATAPWTTAARRSYAARATGGP
jgi:hypothetical protein